MAAQLTFLERLKAVMLPTSGQAIGSLLLSLAFLGLAQGGALVSRLNLPTGASEAARDQFQARFSLILSSPIAGQIALVTFWALLGLVAYLVCWGAYNILIAARNEVTLNTAYTNRGHWRGPYETLALKTASAVGLAVVLGTLWSGASFWLANTSQVIAELSLASASMALGSILGLGLQLYLVLMFIQLTFTPWYRAETFTEA